MLAQPASQEIIAHNNSVIERLHMKISSAGQQRIDSDNSKLTDIDMNIG